LRFTATGKDARGNLIAITPVWSVAGGTGAGGIDAQGEYSPASVGKYTIGAVSGGLRAETDVTVVPGKIAYAKLWPDNATLRVGTGRSFTAAAFDSKGNEVPDATGAWQVTGGVGEVSSSGVFRATAAGRGQVTVELSDGDSSALAKAEVEVEPVPDAGIPPLLLGAIAAIAAAVVGAGLVAGRRRKRRREEEKRRQWQSGSSWGGTEAGWSPQPYEGGSTGWR
jgi:hypothetical protein